MSGKNTLGRLALAILVSAGAARHPPAGWTDVGDAPAEALLELAFFLKLPEAGTAALEAELLARADPRSRAYGAGWLTNEQAHAMVAPPARAVEAVEDWLRARAPGAEPARRTPNGDVITATVSVRAAEALLGADYRAYAHAASNASAVRCLEVALPPAIADAVAIVGPTTRFPPRFAAAPIAERNRSAPRAGLLNDPATLRALYAVDDALGGAAPANRQAVTAFLGQTYSAAAEAAFFERLFPAGAATPIALVGDATAGATPGIEAMLDAEYMPAMGALNPTELWGFAGRSPVDAMDEPFLAWLYAVGNASDAAVPLVFSTSYGEDEASELPSGYAERVNAEFLKGGARGISFLFASGDSGAAAATGPSCPGGRFAPKWPAASPWVTAVGGTQGRQMPETSWAGSSGGFSDAFAAPSWQADALAPYLARADLPDRAKFNASGRGFPDISAAAVRRAPRRARARALVVALCLEGMKLSLAPASRPRLSRPPRATRSTFPS